MAGSQGGRGMAGPQGGGGMAGNQGGSGTAGNINRGNSGSGDDSQGDQAEVELTDADGKLLLRDFVRAIRLCATFPSIRKLNGSCTILLLSLHADHMQQDAGGVDGRRRPVRNTRTAKAKAKVRRPRHVCLVAVMWLTESNLMS